MKIDISQATLADKDKIMFFMHNIWKKGHILSYHEKLFLYDFQEKNKLNFIIAKDDTDKILGLFGFIKYNNLTNPDIAGSLWKVDPKVKIPLLGIQLRTYFKTHIKYDFFAAPGAGLQTKPIYKAIGMNWDRMQQFYFVNQNKKNFTLLKNPNIKTCIKTYHQNITIKKVKKLDEIDNFIFDKNIVPFKDMEYINKRFFNHPIYHYDVYSLWFQNKIKNIFICRKVEANYSSAYRIVDFYGELTYISSIVLYLEDYIQKNEIEYVDFINYGYDNDILKQAGFSLLDPDDDTVIIPNYFEPFVQENISIYCVWDKTEKIFRQHKADGDQDRPNFV